MTQVACAYMSTTSRRICSVEKRKRTARTEGCCGSGATSLRLCSAREDYRLRNTMRAEKTGEPGKYQVLHHHRAHWALYQ